MAGTNKVAAGSLDWRAGLYELFDSGMTLATNLAGAEIREKYPQQFVAPTPASAPAAPMNNTNLILFAVIGVAIYFGFKSFN